MESDMTLVSSARGAGSPENPGAADLSIAADASGALLGGSTPTCGIPSARVRRMPGSASLPVAALIAIVTLAVPDRAAAQGLLEGWTRGAVTIYGWVPGMEGAQDGPNGEPIVSLVSVGILDVLDFAFMGIAEIRRDRVGLVFDLEYADLGADGSARGGNHPGRRSRERVGLHDAAHGNRRRGLSRLRG
jgi:hypothetical protein